MCNKIIENTVGMAYEQEECIEGEICDGSLLDCQNCIKNMKVYMKMRYS